MKFRNYAEKAAWIAWTHDAARMLRNGLIEVAPGHAEDYADAMVEAMRMRETEKSE